jgi:hypothetical protein
MEAIAVLEDAFSRPREVIQSVVDLPNDELYAEPLPSIGWCAWRMGRSLDANISGLLAKEQLWVESGWHERFSMAADRADFQPGFPTPNEITRTFRAPSGHLLLEYFDASYQRTVEYLASLTSADLDRELDEPRYSPLPTVCVRLVSVSTSLAQASGLIRYRLWMAGQD